MALKLSFLRHAQLESFQSVAADAKAVNTLLPGRMVHGVTLEIGDDGTSSNGKDFTKQADVEAFMDAVIGEVRVTVDSKVQIVGKPSEINQIQGICGTRFLAQTAGTAGQATARAILPIMFADMDRNNYAEVRRGAWNLSSLAPQVQIECDINSGIVSPVLGGTVEYEPADENRGLGVITKWTRHNLEALGTKNDYDLKKLIPSDDWLQSLHIFPTETDNPKRYVSEFTIKGNEEAWFDAITRTQNIDKLRRRDLLPDTSAISRFDFVADYTDPLDDAIPVGAFNKLKLYATWNGAAASTATCIILHAGLPN